jgi:nitrogen fixation NifU-like protein
MSDNRGQEKPERPAVLDHFLNPRNIGDVPDADGVGEVGAVSCGDVMRISIKVADGRITDARFRAYGCGTAIATASMATELLKGRTIEEAAMFSGVQLSAALGGIPPDKAHCPMLAEEAVKAALADYFKRRKT